MINAPYFIRYNLRCTSLMKIVVAQNSADKIPKGTSISEREKKRNIPTILAAFESVSPYKLLNQSTDVVQICNHD